MKREDVTQSNSGTASRSGPVAVAWWLQNVRRSGLVAYVLFSVGLICLALTIITTWPLWQNRQVPPNVPMIDGLQGISFGWLILLSLVGCLILPRRGLLVLVILLFVAILFDLLRCQPQIFAFPVLLAACIFPAMRALGRWYLIVMWLWAGIHKLLSPDWMGPASWSLMDRMGFENAQELFVYFAVGIAVFEIALAMVAVTHPRLAAIGCVGLHLGIVCMLVRIDWNFSVLYWNLANAAIGCWLLWTWSNDTDSIRSRMQLRGLPLWQKAAVGILVISPAGVYNGLVPHFLAHVLYSDNMPKAVMTSRDGATEFSMWDSLHAPMPRTIPIQTWYFQLVGQTGDKLHIHDLRAGMPNRYFQLSERGIAEPISQRRFWSDEDGLRGIAKDAAPSIFHLQQAEVRLVARARDAPVFAIEFSAENYSPELFARVGGLLNLEQIQLAGCHAADQDLQCLSELKLLTGIDLSGNESLTDECLKPLEGLEYLEYVNAEGTQITDAALQRLLNSG